MVQLKRNLLSVALASATMMLTAQAQAQSTQSTDQTAEEAAAAKKKAEEAKTLDKVTVTGIRGSIERSIDTKQASNEIIEAVSAEDIGKLPDVSIADSIARLPGLSAQRTGGRAREIHIRGFSGDFSTTTLNGREQVSQSQNRDVEFDQYPSELMSSVVVYKTQNAAVVGQGLSGTVDLRTVRPLDYDKRTIAMNVRGDMNKLADSKQYGNRYSISYIDQFADNTVGLALGYAHLNNPSQNHTFGSWGYEGNGILGGINVGERIGENTRDGLMGTLEFRPGGLWSSTLDVFYSKFDVEEDLHNLETVPAGWATADITSRTDATDGHATTVSFTDLPFVTGKNEAHTINDKSLSVGWRNEFRFGDDWTMTADLSHSTTTREERVLEVYVEQAAERGDTLTYTQHPDGYYQFDFGRDYGDAANMFLTTGGGDATGSWGQDGYLKDFTVEDEINAIRLDFERSFDQGWISSLEFGVNYSQRDKSRAADERLLYLNSNLTPGRIPIPADAIWTTTIGFDGLVGGSLVGVDADAVLGLYYEKPNLNNGDINRKNWEVGEKLTTFYFQTNLDTELLGHPLTGNFGVQAVRADQESSGVTTFQGLTLSEPSTRSAAYTEFLPSLNLKWALPWNQYLRFGVGRQMARPRMDELKGTANFSYDRTRREFSGDGGNPELRPWLANAVDFGYEKYFAETGYFNVGMFAKRLQTYIFNQSTQFDFTQLPIPASQIPPDAPPLSTVGFFSQPVNGTGGTLRGLELALSVPFGAIWQPLDGFGFQGNYTALNSSIKPNPGSPGETLPGLSSFTSNMSLFFERWGFSARVSQRSRSSFRGQVIGFGGDLARQQTFEGESVTDVQLGYAIQSGSLQGLSFLAQIYNLENEPFRQTQFGFPDRPSSYNSYGRTYLFGVNYKF